MMAKQMPTNDSFVDDNRELIPRSMSTPSCELLDEGVSTMPPRASSSVNLRDLGSGSQSRRGDAQEMAMLEAVIRASQIEFESRRRRQGHSESPAPSETSASSGSDDSMKKERRYEVGRHGLPIVEETPSFHDLF